MAKLSDLTVATNPFSGTRTSIFNLGQIWSYVLGVFMLFFVFAMGQKVAGVTSRKVPAIDTTIEPIIKQPATTGTLSKVYV